MPKEPSTANSASSCGGGTGKGRRVKKRLTFYSHKSSRDHLRSPFKKVHIRGNQKYRCSVKKQKFGDRRKVSVLIKTKIRMSEENSLIFCFEVNSVLLPVISVISNFTPCKIYFLDFVLVI